MLSFIPNATSYFANNKEQGRLHLYGEFGLPMGTFLHTSDVSNVRVIAAIDGTEIHLSDSFFITNVSVSLGFSIFHELSNDKSKFVNRRIMTTSTIMATVTWQYGPNGSNQYAHLDLLLFWATAEMNYLQQSFMLLQITSLSYPLVESWSPKI